MLKIVGVSKVYNKSIQALSDINLELSNTGLVVLKGDSGSGKSTLLNMISTLEEPTSGSIYFNDIKLDKKGSLNYLKNEISIIFQDVNMLDNLSVIDNLSIYEGAKDEVNEILKKLDIFDLKDKKVKYLSGGEKRRVSIARAILKHPRILLCDEPDASLDEENRENIFNILKDLSKHMLVIVSSHDGDILEYADRVISLENGKIVNDEVIRKVLDTKIKQDKTYNVSKRFLKVVSKDILFSKKISFLVITFILAIISSLILMSGVMSKFNYVDILVNTMKHEDNHLSDTESVGYEFINGTVEKKLPNGYVYAVLKNYLKLNINVPDLDESKNIYYHVPSSAQFIKYDKRLLSGELLGVEPKESNEIVIYEILAAAIMYYGIEDINGGIVKPSSVEEIIGLEVMIDEIPVRISGISKQNLEFYASFKEDDYYDINKVDIIKNIKAASFYGVIDSFKSMILVNDDFFDYIDGHYTESNEVECFGYEENYDVIRDYLKKENSSNLKNLNLYSSLVNDGNFGDLDLVGTIYAPATNLLFFFYLIGQIILLLSPILVVIMIYVIMMYFENIYKKNREKFAILSCLGLTGKDLRVLYLNSLTMFYGVVLLLASLISISTILVLNNNLSNLVGFYLHPFSLNASYLLISILILVIVFILSYLFLKFRIKKRNAIMYLKNN